MLTDEWFTPVFLLNRVHSFFDRDFIDPASCYEAQEVVKASRFYSKSDNGLLQKWSGRVWLNPPYSKPLINQFVTKLIMECQANRCKEALLLTNAATDTKWFSVAARNAKLSLLIQGRLHFWHPDKKSGKPRYGQSLFYFGSRPEEFIGFFADLGIVCQAVNVNYSHTWEQGELEINSLFGEK